MEKNKDRKVSVVIIFGLPQPRTGKGPIHMQVAEEIAEKLGKGWVFIYTRHLRKMILGFEEPGTEPREDKIVYDWLMATARVTVNAGLNLIVTGVFAYDRYYSFMDSLKDLRPLIKSYRVWGEVSTLNQELVAIKKFHDKVSKDFDVINVELGMIKQNEINRHIKQTMDFIISDLKKERIYSGGD